MITQSLGPIISGNELTSELKQRKRKDQFKTVPLAKKKIMAHKMEREKADGWRVVRTNANSVRMAKVKPADERLENELWSILAQMGFKEMSKGRNFKIDVGGESNSRQIDVFAKDDETVVMVECTQRMVPGKKNMSNLINRISASREPVLKSIRSFYGQQAKLKVGHVIATRHISWSEADLSKCKEAKITVISDAEIEYYAALVQHLKQAARYQFLAHVFSGQKIAGLTRQVVATRGKMGGETFYTFLMRPDELLKIAYVGHKASRDIENLETYQRMLQPRRLKKIAEYINEGGKFPTNIVVNLKTGKRARLKFDFIKETGTETLGKLQLPSNYASAWIIDGQHRLYGYAYARTMKGFNQDISMIPVLAYENLPADKEMNLFIDTPLPVRSATPGPFRGVSAAGGGAHAQGTPRKGPYGGGFRPQATRSGVQDGESPVDRSVIPPFRHRKGLPPARRGPRGEGRAEPDHRPGGRAWWPAFSPPTDGTVGSGRPGPPQRLRRCEVAEGPARTRVQDVLHLPDLPVRHRTEVRALRQILAQQPVRVFVQPPLPGVVRAGEEKGRFQRLRHRRVTGELLAVVGGDRVHRSVERTEHVDHRFPDHIRFPAVNPLEKRVFLGPVHKGHHRAAMRLSDHRVRLPVADALLRLHLLRALGDVHPAGDVTPARVAAALPVRLLSTPPEVLPEPAAVPAVGPDAVVNPLPARHPRVLQPQPAGNPFRAPALFQPLRDLRPALRRQFPRNR